MQNIAKWDIATIDTQRYPIVQPRIDVFAKPANKRYIHRHTLYIAIYQLICAFIIITLACTVYYYLAKYTVYRVVSLVVIAILWSNAASIIAQKKPIDMMETIEHPALKILHKKGDKKRRKAVYNEKTDVFLKAIKASFMEY